MINLPDQTEAPAPPIVPLDPGFLIEGLLWNAIREQERYIASEFYATLDEHGRVAAGLQMKALLKELES